MSTSNINLAARRRARSFALQAVYQWQLTHYNNQLIKEQFLTQQAVASIDIDFFQKLFEGVVSECNTIDEKISRFLDRPIALVNQVERAILRIAAYELIYCLEVPYKVVLNEAVELAKGFASAESRKYVNGILHHMAIACRPLEK